LLASQYSFQWFRTAREEEDDLGLLHKTVPISEPVVDEPIQEVVEQPLEDNFKFLAEYEPEPIPCVKCGTPLTEVPSIGFVCANPECDPPVEETEDEDDSVEIDQAPETEKAAMKLWKANNPDSSLKQMREQVAKGIIPDYPWNEYLKPKEDFNQPADEAAIEAAKWAQEQIDKAEEESSKKKTVSWLEKDGLEQIKKSKEL